tara:strand:- start:21 stop:158 length:138 start_codon:yes stop_codon:yes gene_type:complete
MTLEEINKIITDLSTQIPTLQAQLHQAQGYKQAPVGFRKGSKENS